MRPLTSGRESGSRRVSDISSELKTLSKVKSDATKATQASASALFSKPGAASSKRRSVGASSQRVTAAEEFIQSVVGSDWNDGSVLSPVSKPREFCGENGDFGSFSDHSGLVQTLASMQRPVTPIVPVDNVASRTSVSQSGRPAGAFGVQAYVITYDKPNFVPGGCLGASGTASTALLRHSSEFGLPRSAGAASASQLQDSTGRPHTSCGVPGAGPLDDSFSTAIDRKPRRISDQENVGVGGKPVLPSIPPSRRGSIGTGNTNSVTFTNQDEPATVGYRGVSYLKSSHGADKELIPPTLIPKSDHITIREFQADDLEKGDWEFDAASRMWVKTVFPSRLPAGRQEVQALSEWMNTALSTLNTVDLGAVNGTSVELLLRNIISAETIRDSIDKCLADISANNVVYSLSMHELTRQVFVHCEDRGRLMLRVWSGLKQSFEDMNALYRGAYKDYVNGLEGHLKILTKDLADKTELVERHVDEMRVQEEYYLGKIAANSAMKDSENTKTTKTMKKYLSMFTSAVKGLVALTRGLGIRETDKPNDPQRRAREVLTNYLVDCENLSPRQALEQFESSVALAFGSFTTDEQQEMAWKQEFGFDDEDEETVDDHGADAYAALIRMNSRRLSTAMAHDETPASSNSQTSVVPALSLAPDESDPGNQTRRSNDEDEVAFVVTPLTSAPPTSNTGRTFRFDEAVKYKSLGVTPVISSSRSGSGDSVKLYAGSKEFVLKTAVLARRSADRYSSVLSKICDPDVKPEYSDVWRRGPQGCVVVFTPDNIMELVLKYQSTGLLEVTDREILKQLLKAANDYDFPALKEAVRSQMKDMSGLFSAKPGAQVRKFGEFEDAMADLQVAGNSDDVMLETARDSDHQSTACQTDDYLLATDVLPFEPEVEAVVEEESAIDEGKPRTTVRKTVAKKVPPPSTKGSNSNSRKTALHVKISEPNSISNAAPPTSSAGAPSSVITTRRRSRSQSVSSSSGVASKTNVPDLLQDSDGATLTADLATDLAGVKCQGSVSDTEASTVLEGVSSPLSHGTHSSGPKRGSVVIGCEDDFESACGFDHYCPNCGCRFRPSTNDTVEPSTLPDAEFENEAVEDVSPPKTRRNRRVSMSEIDAPLMTGSGKASATGARRKKSFFAGSTGAPRRESLAIVAEANTPLHDDAPSSPSKSKIKVTGGRKPTTAAKQKKDRYIPVPFQSLFQGTLPVITTASPTLPKRVALKMIQQIYRDKIVADAIDDENDNERQTVPEYVYDWFFNKYGLRKLAEQQLAKMFATVLRFGKKLVDPENQLQDGRQISRNVAMEKNEDALYLFMFGRLLGLFDVLDRDDMDVYMDTLGAVLAPGGAREEDGVVKVPMAKSIQGVQGMLAEYLGGSQSVAWKTFVQKIETSCAAQVKGKTHTRDWVDQEMLMSTVTQEYLSLKARGKQVLRGLFLAADIDGDGNLTVDEFRDVVLLVDSSKTVADIEQIHSGSVNEEGRMTADNFADAAIASGLLSYKPSKVAASTGRKMSSVIQTLLVESAANTKQRFTVLDAAWAQAKPIVESSLANGTASLMSMDDGPEKVKLTAACRMIATQLKRMLQLMKDRTEADEASIAYLLLMNKMKELKLDAGLELPADEEQNEANVAKMLSTYGLKQDNSGYDWRSAMSMLLVAKRLVNRHRRASLDAGTASPSQEA